MAMIKSEEQGCCTRDKLFFCGSLSGRSTAWLQFLNIACTHLKMTGASGPVEAGTGGIKFKRESQLHPSSIDFLSYKVIEYDINLELLQGKPIISFPL